jgi:hypothetical protein
MMRRVKSKNKKEEKPLTRARPVPTLLRASRVVMSAADDDESEPIDRVVRAVSRWPCVTAGVTTLVALITAGIAVAVAGLEVQTEGWTARGTTIADRQTAYELYSIDTFDDGTVNAAWETNPSARRRRRRLLQGQQSSGDQTCAAQYPTNTYYDAWYGFRLIFEAKGDVDLFSPNAFADACEAAENFMEISVGGGDAGDFGSKCSTEHACSGTPPGTSSSDWSAGGTYKGGWENWRRDGSLYKRCSRALSYPTALYSSQGYASCDEYRTNAALQATLARVKQYMLNCSEIKAADSNGDCGTPVADMKYDGRALNSLFGLNGNTRLSLTASNIYTSANQDDVNQWGYDAWKSGWKYTSSYFTIYWDTFQGEVRELFVDEQLFSDMRLAAGAVFIIIVLLWLHMGSLLLTVGGIVQVLLSFPTALFFTKVVCQISFFPFLNFIGIFVIAGIGADDCFVMYDKFQQAKCRCAPGSSATAVMNRSYYDSVWAMLLTSATTSAAFFSNAIMPIAPIRVFAIFMGSMVIFDYIYDITIFAALLSYQHKFIVRYEERNANSFGSWTLDFWGSVGRYRAKRNASKQQQSASTPEIMDSKRDHRSHAERIFADNVFPVIHRIRWFLVIVLLVAFAGGLVGALKLTTPKDSEVALLPENHEFTRFSYLKRSAFKSSSESLVWTKIVWGVFPNDDGDHFDPKSLSSFKWDTSFDIAPTANQEWMKTFCNNTKYNMASNLQSNCWLEYFENWLAYQSLTDTNFINACGSATALPIAESKFYDCAYLYATSDNSPWMAERSLRSAFYRNAASEWRMKIFAVEFGAGIAWTAPTDDLKKVWQKWEDYVKTSLATAPTGLANGFQTSAAWAWMDTVKQMQNGAYIAAATTLGIAFVTMMISTQNVIVTLYAILSILTILVTTIAGIVSMGWTLGFLEGICIVILIGLSVDYVVHIGHAYAHAARHEGATRRECARAALGVMGFPVLSAAFTTLCAALALLQATIEFFTKFGTIVVLSSIFSSIVAVVLFIALLAAVGPTDGWGDVKRLCGRKNPLGKSKSVSY